MYLPKLKGQKKLQTPAQIKAEKEAKTYNFNKAVQGKVKPPQHKVVKVTNMSKVSDDTCQWDFKSVA